MLTDMQKEISSIAKKAAKMKKSSLQMLIFATDILLARDEIERTNGAYLKGENQRNPPRQLV